MTEDHIPSTVIGKKWILPVKYHYFWELQFLFEYSDIDVFNVLLYIILNKVNDSPGRKPTLASMPNVSYLSSPVETASRSRSRRLTLDNHAT